MFRTFDAVPVHSWTRASHILLVNEKGTPHMTQPENVALHIFHLMHGMEYSRSVSVDRIRAQLAASQTGSETMKLLAIQNQSKKCLKKMSCLTPFFSSSLILSLESLQALESPGDSICSVTVTTSFCCFSKDLKP